MRWSSSIKRSRSFWTLTPGNFDADALFLLSEFDQNGWAAGAFGDADNLSRAKGTSVDGVRDAGVVESGGGKVRLLKCELTFELFRQILSRQEIEVENKAELALYKGSD